GYGNELQGGSFPKGFKLENGQARGPAFGHPWNQSNYRPAQVGL
ncbi:uncharacterized protein METZ01_LOCUS434628, partial [marine metagenome]